jgi:predicted GIY-YIG superfamily endonuclease
MNTNKLSVIGKRAFLRDNVRVTEDRYVYDKNDFDTIRNYTTPNLIGDTFGEWVVLAYDISRSSDRKQNGTTVGTHFLCRCSCGKVSSVHMNSLTRNRSTRCFNCANRNRKSGNIAIYMIHAPLVNKVKIGATRNISIRLEQLLSQSPIPLCMIYYKKFNTRKQAVQVEKELHTMLSKKASHGEWFDLSENDIINVRSVLKSIK